MWPEITVTSHSLGVTVISGHIVAHWRRVYITEIEFAAVWTQAVRHVAVDGVEYLLFGLRHRVAAQYLHRVALLTVLSLSVHHVQRLQHRHLPTHSLTYLIYSRSTSRNLLQSVADCFNLWHDTTCCQTGCQTRLTTGFTTGCIVYTNIQPVVKPVWQPVWQSVGCLFTRYSRLSSCTTGLTTGCIV